MTLEGANNLKETNEYNIYTMNSATAGQYCVIMPNNVNDTLNMLIDLHQKQLFDEVSKGTKTKDDLIKVLTDEYLKGKEKYPNNILIVPMINNEEFSSAVATLDKQKMFDETKKIGAITSELYKKLTAAGIDKQKIDQKIIMIENKEEDTKFVNWLKEQMPNFVEGISLTEAPKEEVQAPAEPTATPDIFGLPAEEPKVETPAPAPEPTPAAEPEPTPEVTPEPQAPIFDIPAAPEPTPAPETPPVMEMPTPAETPEKEVDIFGIPADQPAAPVENSVQQPAPTVEATPAPAAEPAPEPVAAPTEEAPKAVQNVELEGTTTFSPIPEPAPQPTETEVAAPAKKSNGFVNIAILLVVLVVVTIVSIELGKFLFSVYGAK